jgi:hypothetical protein
MYRILSHRCPSTKLGNHYRNGRQKGKEINNYHKYFSIGVIQSNKIMYESIYDKCDIMKLLTPNIL